MIYPKVLIVATSKMTRGGITSVIKGHETGEQWKLHHCKWLQTHRDGNIVFKLGYFISALLEYFILLPFYDIIHVHLASGAISAYRKYIFIKAAKLLKKKVIIHYHPSSEKWIFQPSRKVFYRDLFLQADLILVLSGQWKKWLMEALSLNEKIEILYNPCPSVKRIDNLRENSILFAGTIIPRKGYETLLRGFAQIAFKYPEWRITFAGNGEIENAKSIAERLHLENQVEFLGWISGNKKSQVFQKASVYCLASDGEGFPMGILDAWAYGVPCVVTPVGGIPDIIVNGKNGLIFPVGDYHMLATQLEKIIVNKELRNEIVRATDEYVNTVFDVNVINQQLAFIYRKVIEK